MDEEQVKKAAEAIFPSPEVASKFVEMVVSNRPYGWSRKSNAPYYKEVFGLQMKKEVDKMIQTGSSIIFRYSVWCAEDGLTPDSLYTRVNQSIRYLCEKLDPDGKYRRWYESVNVHRKIKTGVVIKYAVGLHESSGMTAEEILPDDKSPKWKRDLDNWLESDNTTPFCQDGLALGPDEISALKVELSQLSNVQCSIKSESVKVIKINV